MNKKIIRDINSEENVKLNKETINKVLEIVTEGIDIDCNVEIKYD